MLFYGSLNFSVEVVSKPANLASAPSREPGKSILKTTNVTFAPQNPPDVVPFVQNIDSIDDQVVQFMCKDVPLISTNVLG